MLDFVRRRRPAPSLPPGQRVYAVGDVHGRRDLLDELIATIAADQSGREPLSVEVLLLGDLIDRGPDSAGVVTRAMTPLPWAQLTALKGNHEAALLGTLNGSREMALSWLRNGGDTALASWGVDIAGIDDLPSYKLIDITKQAIPAEIRTWLARLPTHKHLGDYYFVHAGVRPGTPLGAQRTQDRLWIRDEFLLSKRFHGAVVVHGHSIAREIEERPNRIGIDTGAYATGRLTAVALEGDRRWYIQTGASAAVDA